MNILENEQTTELKECPESKNKKVKKEEEEEYTTGSLNHLYNTIFSRFGTLISRQP